MHPTKNIFKSIASLYIAAGLLVLVSGVLFFLPRQASHTQAENCQPVYDRPIFNPYPISWSLEAGTNCKDFPVISGNVTGAGSWQSNFSAKAGDIITLRLYVHNGAALNSGHVMNNVRISTSMDPGASSSHVIRTTLSASNAASKSGTVIINTGPNDRLEVISGSLNHNLGTLQPCFEFSRAFIVQLRVVSDQPEPKTLNLTTDKLSYCVGDVPRYTVNGSSNLAGEYLRWSSTKNGSSTGENRSGYGHTLNSNGDWSGNGNRWNSSHIGTWTKTAHAGGVDAVSRPFTVEDCTPPAPKTLNITTDKLSYCVGDVPRYSVTGSDSLANEYIRWSSTKNGSSTGENRAGYGHRTDNSGDWQGYGNRWNSSHIGTWTKTAHAGGISATTRSFAVEDCTPPEPKTLNLTTDKLSYCVGDVPRYTVNGSSNLAGEYLRWSSTKNGSSTGENRSGYGHTLNSNGDWSGNGNRWNSSHIGTWTKTAHAGGVDAVSRPFTVEDCTPPDPDLVCSPANQTADINQTINFTARGGNGAYAWSAPGGNPPTNLATNSNFSTKYSSSGNKTVTVRSGNQSTTCHVTVRTPEVPRLTCSPGSQSADINQTVRFTASGGSGSYSWSAPGGAPAGRLVSASSSFSTRYGSSGNKTVTVRSGNQSATCAVNVNVPPTSQLTCSPSNQSVDIGQTARFTASGGSGSYAWVANGGNPSSGSGNGFNTRYSSSGNKTVTVRSGNQTATCAVNVNREITPQNITCPLSTRSNRTIVDFNKDIIVSWRSAAEAQDGPYSVNLPSGRYNVTLVSYDDHVGKAGQQQPLEQYYLSLRNSSGSQITRTNSISDLPDNQNYLTEQVNSNLNLSQSVSSVLAVHPAFFNSNPNSIVPVCAAFDRIDEPANAQLTLTKEVRNLTSGGGYSSSAQAENGDTVQYRITVGNIGDATAEDVTISDNFGSSGITRIGSINVSTNFSGSLNSGINVGQLSPGGEVVITYDARVNISNGSVTNTAIASASNAGTVSDTANVFVSTVAGQPQLTIDKTVRNLTSGGIGFVNSVSARNNDEVEFRIIVTNVGNAIAENVRVRDIVPGGLDPISGSLGSDVPVSGQLTGSGITINQLLEGQSATLFFRARVVQSSGTLVNVARASADNASEVSDDAFINLIHDQNGSLSINKLVRNMTQGGSFSSSATAESGNRVEYEITVTANNGTVNNVRLTDSLPNNLSVINGSVRVDGSSSVSGLFGSGLHLGTMSAGQQKRVTFEAFVHAQSGLSQTIITNTATASGDNVGTVNDSATVYVNQQTDNGFKRLSITKSVRSQNSGFYQNSVNVNNGETVNFEIVVTNTGNRTINNVRVQDFLPSGLELVFGSVRIDGSSGPSHSANLGEVFLGSLGSGQQRRIYFDARVNRSSGSIQNVARAFGDNVSSVQDDAWVFVSGVGGGNVNLNFSKRAVNETKNVDATVVPASREDFITYTLTVTNNGNSPAHNFVITDDLSQVLQYADMVDRGGGSLNGNVISYPGITVPAHGSVSKSFKVRVKFSLADNLSYTMVNTYGNTVTIQINTPQVLGTFIAPTTGANLGGLYFGSFMTAAFALVRKRKYLMSLIGI